MSDQLSLPLSRPRCKRAPSSGCLALAAREGIRGALARQREAIVYVDVTIVEGISGVRMTTARSW